ncbi:DUF3068 domain-containing protein [Candidatus Woesearchaeota archaeon]|nr:DUF3068 domain-containing protein [Candidatus Woesearchaeota archaeon]
MKNKNIFYLIIGVILLAIIPIWLLYFTPILLEVPSDFYYSANIFSIDNFYDPEIEDFSGQVNSEAAFFYEVVGEDDENDVLLIKNVFKVSEPGGEEIFSVERIYGIDKRTGQHVSGYGDRDRDGYLFAPGGLKKSQPYIYWHINYDAPALMEFKEEENLFGLKVYRYEADYNADQTKDLSHLPGVPEEKGVNLDINLQAWIEPVTGRLIRYEDNAIAYYYDIETGERIHPWNKFNNFYKASSFFEEINLAKREKAKLILYKKIMPAVFAVASFISFALFFVYRRKDEN